MLTLEETGWSLRVFKICSTLNILPIGVDVKSGRIQRQSNPVKFSLWKFLYGVGVLHWLYVFGRLVQSTILDPQKYFRWDHFVLHFGMAFLYAVFYFTGFWLFVKNEQETVMIFNQLFEERENPVQKMVDQEQEELERQMEPGNGNGKRGNKTRTKSATLSTSNEEPHEEIEMAVIENPSEFVSDRCEDGPRPLLMWPPQYSLDELMAKLVPLLIGFTGVGALLFFAIDPTRPQLLYSVLPPEWQNVWSFLSLLLAEILCLGICCFTASFAIVIQVLFFAKCQLEFQRMSLQLRDLEEKFQNRSMENDNCGREMKREIWILRQILEEMRELVVFIELFNRCFPFCIFATKIFALSVSITWYFFALRHSEDFPFFGIFMGYCAIAVTLIYVIMYAKAFSISGNMEDLKNEFLLTAQKTTRASAEIPNANGNKTPILWREMKREVKRIPDVGVKVGSFHQMERESTPNFIDFVVSQVVDLLVTFPR